MAAKPYVGMRATEAANLRRRAAAPRDPADVHDMIVDDGDDSDGDALAVVPPDDLE